MKNREKLETSPLGTGRRLRRLRLFSLTLATAVIVGGLWYKHHLIWKGPLTIPAKGGVADWPAYGRDAGDTRFAPLTQITPWNVRHLERAWVYRTGESGDASLE